MTIRLALAGPAGAESPNWLSSSPPPPARPQSSHDGPSSSTHPQTRRAPSSAHRSPAQASFPHGCWRAGGSSAGRGAIRQRGDPGSFTAHRRAALCPAPAKLAQRRTAGPACHPGRAGPHRSSPTAPRQRDGAPFSRHVHHKPHHNRGLPVTASQLSQHHRPGPGPHHLAPQGPAASTEAGATQPEPFPTGVRRLTPSQDLTATASQYPRAPREASYPAPSPTARSRAPRPLLTLPTPAFYQPLDFPKLLLATGPLHISPANYLLLIIFFFLNLFQYNTENTVNIP